MKKHLIIGGTGGIGLEIIKQLSNDDEIINFSRQPIPNQFDNVIDYNIDVLSSEFPEIEELNSIIYCPGSINLKPIGSLKEEDFLNDFNINVVGAVRVIKHYYKLLKRNNGNIILFSTVASKIGMPFHASVSASKSAVEGLTKSLAAELAPNVRVNCIAPTITDTPLASQLLRNDKARESTADRHPLKRFLQPSEVAAMAVFLISDNAKNITGQIIGIDAGLGSIKT